MSTARRAGNTRTRPQKHQNEFAWSFAKHKTDPTTKVIQNVVITNCCRRCTDILNWKISYGKYKPLSRPSKCVKCSNRTIKYAYHVLCTDCSLPNGLCAKCGESAEIVQDNSSE
uniref:C9orf85 homolog n=1 Tax=Lepeophtheirus salmonis TaxID=72036 RepID=C1BVG8_LEPSM|nr:C9orf85 homolog [Lepeophtheirus salmonis]